MRSRALIDKMPSDMQGERSSLPLKRSIKPVDRKRRFLGQRKQTPEIWFSGVPTALIQASQETDKVKESLVKLHSFAGPTKRIAMDCEFVGVGFEGKDSALARVSIVNQFGHVLLDEYVRPTEKITDYRTAVSGITPKLMRIGGPAKDFKIIHEKVSELCNGRILIGHAVHHDLKVLMLSHPRKDTRDTAYYKPFKTLFNERTPSLKNLTERVLGVRVQHGEHDSVEDARAAMRLYTSVKRIWEAQIRAIALGKSAKEVRELAAHLRFTSVINEDENMETQNLKPTSLAKIALDAASEFSSGIAPISKIKHKMNPRNSNIPTTCISPLMTQKPKSGLVDNRGRKCSKRRANFIEKRNRIRKKKTFLSSSSFLS